MIENSTMLASSRRRRNSIPPDLERPSTLRAAWTTVTLSTCHSVANAQFLRVISPGRRREMLAGSAPLSALAQKAQDRLAVQVGVRKNGGVELGEDLVAGLFGDALRVVQVDDAGAG